MEGILARMPVIVVGADTESGAAILERLYQPRREIRAFVSDEATGRKLRERGFKVAIGDVSDSSHVEGAATRCFSAVLISEAARDDRERAFAGTSEEVLEGWADAVGRSQVTRVIWVTTEEHPETKVSEVATVDPGRPDLADVVFRLDEAHSIS